MTKVVKIGTLGIGGKNPVRIKGMIKTPSSRLTALIREARELEREGAEALRVAVKQEKDAKLAGILKKHINIPLVADVHFHHRLALLSIDGGFEGVRLNPANISVPRQVKEVARLAKKNKVSLRVGVNSGGWRQDFSSPDRLARQMVKRVEGYLKILEKENFFDIMVSLKGSDTLSTITANKLFAEKFNYPLHLGVTASGPFLDGLVKSSLGIGSLLEQGIGSVIRVSLTAPARQEIKAAKSILGALNLRRFGPEIISCPTCSRCEVNLIKIAAAFDKKIQSLNLSRPLRIALMGCVVNGPGEAYQADIGAAFGSKKGAIFRKDKILGYVDEKNVIDVLLKEISKM
jgi:(E)-4-hydroxy-3-methylbut-2-enyl-diphosphate synthase